MPTATRRSSLMSGNAKPLDKYVSSGKLRPISDDEIAALRATYDTSSRLSSPELIDLNEPYEHPFLKEEEGVWVRTKEHNWCYGKVTSHLIRVGWTRQGKPGFYYSVNFGNKFHLRKYFAPLNGELKPDTKEVRQLLQDHGWISKSALPKRYRPLHRHASEPSTP